MALVYRNWLIGYRIAEEELNGKDRAEFGAKIIKQLSKELTGIYGKGFDRSNLYRCLQFYKLFPQIVDSVRRQLNVQLSWTHYRVLLQVNDKEARDWYEKEAIGQTWSVRTLQRNISSQYYYRLLKSQVKEPVIEEMKQLTDNSKYDKLEFIKNPVIAEFLSLSTDTSFTETQLESSIISNLQKLYNEFGDGRTRFITNKHAVLNTLKNNIEDDVYVQLEMDFSKLTRTMAEVFQYLMFIHAGSLVYDSDEDEMYEQKEREIGYLQSIYPTLKFDRISDEFIHNLYELKK